MQQKYKQMPLGQGENNLDDYESNLIREISKADVNSVFRLMRMNMHSYYLERDERWNEQAIRKYFSSKKGIVLARGLGLEACSFYELKGDELQIHTLQVEPIFQNKLIGIKFFRWYIDKANDVGAKAITCSVYASNPAFEMYLRMGFIEVGRDNGVIQLTIPLTKKYLGREQVRT